MVRRTRVRGGPLLPVVVTIALASGVACSGDDSSPAEGDEPSSEVTQSLDATIEAGYLREADAADIIDRARAPATSLFAAQG